MLEKIRLWGWLGGNYAPVHKNEAARNKFPWKESTPETQDCEWKTYLVEVEEGKFGCGGPRSIAHGLTKIAELFGDLFLSRLVSKFN